MVAKKKTGLFALILTILISVGIIVIITNKPPEYTKGTSAINDTAVLAAVDLYKKRVASGMDFSSGPCLTNDLMPGWVVDIVHSPRQLIDDLPANQCQAYIEGRAVHFVELDLNGNLVRVQ